MSYGPKPKKVAYVVFRGIVPGIYESWDQAKPQVEGIQGAQFKGYYTYEDACDAWEAWEAGKSSPSNASNKLLYLVEKDENIINQLVAVK